jgi:hypothetical protein
MEGLGAATLSLDIGQGTALDREAMLSTVYRGAWNPGLGRQIPGVPSDIDIDIDISRLPPPLSDLPPRARPTQLPS